MYMHALSTRCSVVPMRRDPLEAAATSEQTFTLWNNDRLMRVTATAPIGLYDEVFDLSQIPIAAFFPLRYPHARISRPRHVGTRTHRSYRTSGRTYRVLGRYRQFQNVSTTPQLVSISLSPLDSSMAAGLNQQLTATGLYSDGFKQDISSSVGWSSSQTAIATISGSGTVTGLASGSTTITAEAGDIAGTTKLTVTAAHLVSIGVTPAAPSIALGTTRAFKATATYSDNSIHDVTDTVSWQSVTPTVAAVSSAAGHGISCR